MLVCVAILTPYGSSSLRGNAVSVARIVRVLEGSGVELSLWDFLTRNEVSIEAAISEYVLALIYAFYAYWVGSLAMCLAFRSWVLFVVICTGTDANHDLDDLLRAEVVQKVLSAVGCVIVFHVSIVDRILIVLLAIRERLTVVLQSVDFLMGEVFDLVVRWPLFLERVLFLLPVGFRAVKNPVFLLVLFGCFVMMLPEIRLLYVGSVLNAGVGENLERVLVVFLWARCIGAVPHAQIGSLLS